MVSNSLPTKQNIIRLWMSLALGFQHYENNWVNQADEKSASHWTYTDSCVFERIGGKLFIDIMELLHIIVAKQDGFALMI